MEIHKEGEIVLEERRQKHFGTSSRSQKSSQLTEMNQSRDYKQI